MTERYVQRTKWLGFPDTIAVRFLKGPDMTSTLALIPARGSEKATSVSIAPG